MNNHALEAIVVTLIIFLGPSIVVAFLGWRFTRNIDNQYRRILVRSAILSVAFAPSAYGHAGILFASWALFLVPAEDKFTLGVVPIVVVWLVGGGAAITLRWLKSRRVIHANDT